MTGPEYLDDARPRSRPRRSWLVLAAIMLVLVGLVVVRVRQPTEPAPEPVVTPSASPSPSRVWPRAAGLPAGTLFVIAEGRVHAIDVSSGLLSSTRVVVDPFDGDLTPIGNGVLVLPHNGRPPQLLLVYGAGGDVAGALRTANSFLPGPDGSVWAAKIDPREPAEKNTWRRVNVGGRVQRSVEVTGVAASDGAGGLLALDRERVQRVQPEPPGPRQPGDVVAVGPDGYVLRDCAARCFGVLYDRVSDRYRDLPGELSETAVEGAVSPGNQFVAVKLLGEEESIVQVLDVYSGGVRRSFPEPGSGKHAITWLGDRWLVLVSEDQLVLYDVVTDVMVTPNLPLTNIGPLVWQPT